MKILKKEHYNRLTLILSVLLAVLLVTACTTTQAQEISRTEIESVGVADTPSAETELDLSDTEETFSESESVTQEIAPDSAVEIPLESEQATEESAPDLTEETQYETVEEEIPEFYDEAETVEDAYSEPANVISIQDEAEQTGALRLYREVENLPAEGPVDDDTAFTAICLQQGMMAVQEAKNYASAATEEPLKRLTVCSADGSKVLAEIDLPETEVTQWYKKLDLAFAYYDAQFSINYASK